MIPRPSSHSAAIGPGITGSLAQVPEAWFPTDNKNNISKDFHLPNTDNSHPFSLDPALCDSGLEPKRLTQYPIVTGSSILALKFKDGIAIASDTLASYGRTKRYMSVQRLHKFGNSCLVAASGELSDFDHIKEILEECEMDDFCEEDGITLGPKRLYSLMCRIMYNKRSDMNPLWNSIVIGGIGDDGKPFLGSVAMIGTHYQDDHIATGFGNHLARPLFRELHRLDMTKEEAVELLKKGLKVCFARDSSTMNKFQIGIVSTEGVEISEPFAIELNWNYKDFVNPSRNVPGCW